MPDSLVPWNASWSSEESFAIRPCRYADGRRAIWQPYSPGRGRPIFARPHSVRQRRSIAEMRCTVCGDATPIDDRWWFGHGQVDGLWFRTQEAPVHHGCAVRGRELCPHLRDMASPLRRFPDRFSVHATLIGGPAVKTDFGLDIAPGEIVVGTLKLCWPLSEMRMSA